MTAGPAADAIVAAYVRDRLSVGQCALEFGLSRAQVRRVLDRRGVVRDRGRRMPRVSIDEDALVAAYRQGLSLHATAQKFGVHDRTAARVLDRHQVCRHAVHFRGRAVDEGAIVRAYRDEGKSLSAAAREAGIKPEAARRVLAAYNVTLRPPHTRKEAGIDEAAVVASRVRNGLTGAETAATFGISPQTVRRIMARHQSPAPSPADLITASKAAAILGIHRRQVPGSARTWGIEIHRTSGGHRRYRRGQITDAAARLGPGAADGTQQP